MVDINEVAENIYMIDDQLYSISNWGSVYLLNEERKTLIESEPAADDTLWIKVKGNVLPTSLVEGG